LTPDYTARDIDLATGVIRIERGWDEVEGEVAPKSKQGRRGRGRGQKHLAKAGIRGRRANLARWGSCRAGASWCLGSLGC
jgi:hypothetical protein